MLIVLFRAVILYVVIVFCIRLMGKKQLGELQPSELVVTIMLSNIATLPIEDTNIPVTMGLVPIFTIVCIDVFFSFLSMQSRGFRKMISGSPKIIISNGRLDQHVMKELRFTVDDLYEALRGQQIFDISDVQLAVVETTGQLSAYPKKSCQPLTGGDIGLGGETGDPPMVVIDDGKLISGALEKVGADGKWLKTVLRHEGVGMDEVFIMTCDSSRKYELIKKEEQA